MLITHSCFAPIEYSHALRSASFQQWPATRHKHHFATLREGNVARKRRFHETLRGRSRIDFPIRDSTETLARNVRSEAFIPCRRMENRVQKTRSAGCANPAPT